MSPNDIAELTKFLHSVGPNRYGAMLCQKRDVVAVLVHNGTPVSIGRNLRGGALLPETCPRVEEGYAEGEGYHLCRERCGQNRHAERDALLRVTTAAPEEGDIVEMWLTGHDRICDDCQSVLESAGVTDIYII